MRRAVAGVVRDQESICGVHGGLVLVSSRLEPWRYVSIAGEDQVGRDSVQACVRENWPTSDLWTSTTISGLCPVNCGSWEVWQANF